MKWRGRRGDFAPCTARSDAGSAVVGRDPTGLRRIARVAPGLLPVAPLTTDGARVAEGDPDDELQAELLAYMRDNPASADTLDAIAEWWVMRRVVHVEVQAVARVLGRLVEAGLVEVVDPARVPAGKAVEAAEPAPQRRYRLTQR